MADCWSNFVDGERPTVSLTMIVKDEEHIIRECLESIAPYIDRYDISDTGSTDKTKEIIKNLSSYLQCWRLPWTKHFIYFSN